MSLPSSGGRSTSALRAQTPESCLLEEKSELVVAVENVSVWCCMGVVGVLGGGCDERSNSLTQISSVLPSSRGVNVYLVSQGRLTFSYGV